MLQIRPVKADKLAVENAERMEELENARKELENGIVELKEKIASFDEDNARTDKFIAVVRRYTGFTELTTPMLNEFIKKVAVHETTGGRANI